MDGLGRLAEPLSEGVRMQAERLDRFGAAGVDATDERVAVRADRAARGIGNLRQAGRDRIAVPCEGPRAPARCSR